VPFETVAAQIGSEDDHFLAFLRSVASRACLLVGDIKALRALLAALGCIAAVLDHAPRHPELAEPVS
jgi:hypothetical protein